MSIKVTYGPVVASAIALTAALIGQGTARAETQTITKYLTRGGWASGWARAQLNECEYADIYVTGNEFAQKQGKWQNTNNATASIQITNYCTPIQTAGSGYAFLDGAFVPPNNNLESAATDELIISEMCDYTSSCWPTHISVRATWTGVGNISRTQSRYHYRVGSYNSVSMFNGTSRGAEVVVELDGEPVPYTWQGGLGYAISGSVEITRTY